MLEYIKHDGGFLRLHSLLIKKKFTAKNQHRPFLPHLGDQHSVHIVFMVANIRFMALLCIFSLLC
ncbi:MAG: hypothetical protein GPOALKHO_000516 [Sodalis sp.]|nr:MAG: hypothetical protein GPOALKHO_000516 [Sodalis sp.]